jgi:hypothetical protein
MSSEGQASDGVDFAFSSEYGNDLLNHIARVVLDEGTFSALEIKLAIAAKFDELGGDVGLLWEEFCEEAVAHLHSVVEDSVESR